MHTKMQVQRLRSWSSMNIRGTYRLLLLNDYAVANIAKVRTNIHEVVLLTLGRLSFRLIALELHSRFGNSVLQDRASEEEARANMLRQMLDERSKDIFNLHAERKTEQMKIGAKLKVVEEQLRELTSKNRNLHKHCEQLQNTA